MILADLSAVQTIRAGADGGSIAAARNVLPTHWAVSSITVEL